MILINVSDYCRISLGEYCAACDPDAVFSSVESVPDVLLSEQIFSEGLSLCSDPFERQTAGDVDISIVDVFTPQFSGYSRQCQDVVVFVDSFIRDELLVLPSNTGLVSQVTTPVGVTVFVVLMLP